MSDGTAPGRRFRRHHGEPFDAAEETDDHHRSIRGMRKNLSEAHADVKGLRFKASLVVRRRGGMTLADPRRSTDPKLYRRMSMTSNNRPCQ